jgi:hypothetical protein
VRGWRGREVWGQGCGDWRAGIRIRTCGHASARLAACAAVSAVQARVGTIGDGGGRGDDLSLYSIVVCWDIMGT